MVISTEEELVLLKDIGRLCAVAMQTMADALEPGITTAELDAIGRKVLEDNGAQSAPEFCYKFPGATCISVNEEVAHGIPGPRIIKAGDLVNIDVSAVKNGFFGDTGSSFAVPPVKKDIERLCRDGKRAMWTGLQQVKTGRPFADIGNAIGAFAKKNRYTLITNLASHGIGRSLHEEPKELATGRTRTSGASCRKAWCSPSSRSCRPGPTGPRTAMTIHGRSIAIRARRRCSMSIPWLRRRTGRWC